MCLEGNDLSEGTVRRHPDGSFEFLQVTKSLISLIAFAATRWSKVTCRGPGLSQVTGTSSAVTTFLSAIRKFSSNFSVLNMRVAAGAFAWFHDAIFRLAMELAIHPLVCN